MNDQQIAELTDAVNGVVDTWLRGTMPGVIHRNGLKALVETAVRRAVTQSAPPGKRAITVLVNAKNDTALEFVGQRLEAWRLVWQELAREAGICPCGVKHSAIGH